ncbi:uncharacterized protein PgNI_12083 [Pyricularia grisea]|uniref:Methyltransferase domain-containing protein n=1 Tax=Pyricularia grisea TaxID=148305 RepID=A0A6P8AQY7_PYRGI|nr:uncharacterized protein PgNI_12083 [Pyricularia grisea]TLD04456.1 hypothetical protein PgNI_12083 [Pyricularia grisea]
MASNASNAAINAVVKKAPALTKTQTGLDSLNILNQLFTQILNRKLHTKAVKIKENSHILDLGCGSGLWVMLMALNPKLSSIIAAYLLEFEGEKVLLNRVTSIPQTVTFTPVDIKREWTGKILQHTPYDLINCRMIKGSMKSWPTIYEKIATHLTPGTGVFKQFKIDLRFQYSSGLIPNALKQWADKLHQAMEEHGMFMRCDPEEIRCMLLKSGFDNVKERAIIFPINDWPLENDGKKIGKWFNLALTNSLLPMSLSPLVRTGNNKVKEINNLINKASEELNSQARTEGVYCIFYIWTAIA